jgi:hypothetical protein
MAAMAVEFPEPEGCPAVALARPAAGFSMADHLVAAGVSGCSVEGSAAIGPAAVVLARRWLKRGCSGAG